MRDRASLRHGHQLQQVTVGIPEIKPASATPIVELAVIYTFRRAAIGEPCRLDAIEDGIELGVAHVKGVVVALERVGVVEQQRRLIVHTYRCEVADTLALQAEDIGEEACRRRLVADRNDGVVEDDRHVMPPRRMLSSVAEYTAAGSIVPARQCASTAEDCHLCRDWPSSIARIQGRIFYFQRGI